MTNFRSQIRKLAQVLESQKLKPLPTDKEVREKEIAAFDHPVEDERPLLGAEPTTVPGTWKEPSGSLIKTSKDPE